MSFWKDRNVFVSGATGLLGSHFIELLLSEKSGGGRIVALTRDNLFDTNTYFADFHNRVILIKGSIEDIDVLKILRENNIDTVFHFAAQTIVSVANKDPVATFETNIKGTWRLLDACRILPKIEKVLVASSDKAYGEQEQLPYIEDMPLRGTHPYDFSKSCVDMMAYTYYNTYALPVCIARCGNYYGPGDLNFNRIVPGTILSVLNNEAPVIRGDGNSIRDYFYIKDGAIAYKLLAEAMDSNTIHGEAFNFSYGTQTTSLELISEILKLMRREDMKPIILNQASNEIKHQYLSSEKAAKMLGWTPKYTFSESLAETIDWYKYWWRKNNYSTIAPGKSQ